MANIKISELNELYNAQKDYGDYVPIVDTSANETKKISVQNLIPSNIELIAITDTEPIEYETGDKYYNTTNNRIYTATSGGWINPQEPIKGILYIILEEQKSYTYDGTTLISVGGGAGGIVVYPNIPDEDTQLYIEEEDLDFQGLEIADEYTTGDNVAYSADYSNSAFGGKVLWTNPNPTSNMGETTIQINNLSDYDVIEVYVKSSTTGNNMLVEKIINGFGSTLKWWNAGTGKFNERGMTTNINNNTITFTRCSIYDVGYNDNILIPLYIVGYRIGLFN